MILQLPFLLNSSSNIYIEFEITVLIAKKPPKPSRKLRKKLYDQLVKKLPKLDEKTRKKTNYLCFLRYFVKGEKPLNLARKTERKTGYQFKMETRDL